MCPSNPGPTACSLQLFPSLDYWDTKHYHIEKTIMNDNEKKTNCNHLCSAVGFTIDRSLYRIWLLQNKIILRFRLLVHDSTRPRGWVAKRVPYRIGLCEIRWLLVFVWVGNHSWSTPAQGGVDGYDRLWPHPCSFEALMCQSSEKLLRRYREPHRSVDAWHMHIIRYTSSPIHPLYRPCPTTVAFY